MTRVACKATATALLLLAFASAVQAQTLVIDSIRGPITQHELDAFRTFMATRSPPPNTWGTGKEHNALGDGAAGRDLEAMALMYEATHDGELLNRMVFFADAFVAMRNDLPGGEHRVMWTGMVDKVWPPENPTTPAQPSQVAYAGGENSDTIAHIEYAALVILRNQAIWNTTVPDGDPHGYGATYLARAKTYAVRCAEANDDYAAKYFVQPTTNLIRNPPNWPAGFHTMQAINIQMMVLGGFQRDAEVHELLGGDAARVARYDAIVKTAVRECLDGMKHAYDVNGHTAYKWYYYPYQTSGNESVGHAAYDVLGVSRAFNRPAYGITMDEVAPISNTLSYVISLGNGMFASNVDGTGTPQNYMLGEWTLASVWNDTAFPLVASAAIASKRFATHPDITAPILALKARAPAPPVTDGSSPAAAGDGGDPADGPSDAGPSRPGGTKARPACGCFLGTVPTNTAFAVSLLVAVLMLALRARSGRGSGAR